MLRLQAPLPERYAAATGDELAAMIGAAKASLGRRVSSSAITTSATTSCAGPTPVATPSGSPGIAAGQAEAEFVVFCGVHFMAESADVLTADHQQVLLPDLNAGCSMADMADIDQVEEAWEELGRVIDVDGLVPITYMNSAAALKAFVGRHGGAVCTSSNARAVLDVGPRADGGETPGRRPLLPRSAPGPQHRVPAGLRRRRHAGVEPAPGPGRAERP